jgi:hypothetical protein
MADRLAKLDARRLPPPGPSVERDETLSAWLQAAARAAAQIAAGQESRLMEWAEDVGDDPAQATKRFRQLPRVLFDDDAVELNHQVTLAALLYGMAAAGGKREAGSGKRMTTRLPADEQWVLENSSLKPQDSSLIRIANAGSPILERLGFDEAITGLARRVGLIKYTEYGTLQKLPAFMDLDAANRSRAFTMAWIGDLKVMQQVHEQLVQTAAAGESLYDWRIKRIEAVKASGWEGSPLGEAHYQLVYRQNLGMAYSAGKYESGTRTGFKVVRILPTLSQNPRSSHEKYVGQMFRIDSESMLPPWDFGCNHGWEWVFPEELERANIDPESLELLRFDDADQDFQWRPAAYMALSINPGEYSGPVRDIAEDMGRS